MDEFDRAQALEEQQREVALKNARAHGKFKGESEPFCIDCDDEIPEARRALGGIERCVECQSRIEKY